MVDKIDVQGIAVVEGLSRNGIFYQAEELMKFTPTLKGKPILKDHNAITDNVIGKITKTYFMNGMVFFDGWIKNDDKNIIDKINDGRISEVSIGAIVDKLVKEKSDDEFTIAKGMTGVELSLVVVPGVVGTKIIKK